MFDYYVRKYCKACNIVPALSLHKLRKTYASSLHASGIPLKVIQTQLGHNDANTTLKYYMYTLYDETQLVEIMKNTNVIHPDTPKSQN